jgi:hypothetical protein
MIIVIYWTTITESHDAVLCTWGSELLALTEVAWHSRRGFCPVLFSGTSAELSQLVFHQAIILFS